MPRKRSGAGGLALSTVAAYLLISIAWAAQPNEIYPRLNNADQQGSVAHRESQREKGPGGPGDVHDLQNHDEKERTTNTFESDFELETLSASQTFAPAHQQDTDDVGGIAVRAPVPEAGFPTIYERSLQDWVMEDLILMATVDGSVHARDRKTGKERWQLESEDYPMVEMTYNRTGFSSEDALSRTYWVIEPSKDGDIYLYIAPSPKQRTFLQRLGISVRDLADKSPYSHSGSDVVYTATKTTNLYTFDAKTGNVLAVYGAEGASFEDLTTCRMTSPFGGTVESECNQEGSLSLGRATYTITIQKRTGETICKIKYNEWLPNQRDNDLQNQYSSSMDQSYVYTTYNGRVTALKQDPSSKPKGVWTQKLSAPVVKVFDVVRPAHTDLRDSELVLLHQPFAPAGALNLIYGQRDGGRVYLNQTKPESFYAMSERTYPSVTDGAKDAQCYNKLWVDSLVASGFRMTAYETTQSMIGVHHLANLGKKSPGPGLIPPSDLRTIDPPPEGANKQSENRTTTISENTPAPPSSSVISNSYIVSSFAKNPIDLTVLLIIGIVTFLYATGRLSVDLPVKTIKLKDNIPKVEVSQPDEPIAEQSTVTKVDGKQEAHEDHTTTLPDIVVPDVDYSKLPAPEEAKPDVVQVAPPIPATEKDSESLKVDQVDQAPPSIVVEEQVSTPKVRIVEPTKPAESEKADGLDVATPLKKKKARRGQRAGKDHRRKQKGGKTDEDAEGEGSIDLTVAKVAEVNKDQVTQEIQPDAAIPQTMGDPTRVNGTTIRIGNLTVFEDTILGYGSHGTRVFKGTFGGRDVAVKCMLKEFYDVASQEVNLLQESDDHRNVVRYYDKETFGGFLYIALELCPATLAEVVDRSSDFLSLLGANGLDRVDALRQITRGIRYLHSLKIVHRDIKPENILVAAGKKRLTQPDVIQPPRMLISDFGLCKKLDVDQSSFRATTAHAAGTSGWRAPELLVDDDNIDNTRPPSGPGTQNSTASEPVVLDTATNRRATRAIDIFALGCIFFYVLSNGNHPFDGSARGEGRYFREVNIIKGRHDLSELDILGDYRGEAEDLIANMIAREPRSRPDAGQILAHPFFWSPAKRLDFLCQVSDQFEFEPRDPPSQELQILESTAHIVLRDCGGDFLSRLPQAFLATLAKQRKYQGGRMLDVLRALRNKKNHYEDMPQNVKAMTGSLPEGYLLFWTTRFPFLLMVCHQVVKDCGWHRKDRFREFYEPPSED